MLSIGAVKAVEIGSGYRSKDMTGSESNDQMFMKNGKVAFKSNNAGGVTGGLATGQPIVARLAVKPTPTIARDQDTIDKVSLKDAKLAAVTRRDPTIVSVSGPSPKRSWQSSSWTCSWPGLPPAASPRGETISAIGPALSRSQLCTSSIAA
jgi:hypothetical protein